VFVAAAGSVAPGTSMRSPITVNHRTVAMLKNALERHPTTSLAADDSIRRCSEGKQPLAR
jgi:hypothetical protein